jgi:hypothetical protein
VHRQLASTNAIYARMGIEFATASMRWVIDPVATGGGRDDDRYTMEELAGDIVQHLPEEFDDPDPQAVRARLIEMLLAAGVDGGQNGRVFSLQTRWRASDLYRVLARARNRHISVVVRVNNNSANTANYPFGAVDSLLGSVIILSRMNELSALPHELGHYFGLIHTHGATNDRILEAECPWEAASVVRRMSDDDLVKLRALAGDDYASDFTDTWLAFDADEQARSDYWTGQSHAKILVPNVEQTYKPGFVPIAGVAELIQRVEDDLPVYRKNFLRDFEAGSGWSGNNCGRRGEGGPIECRFGVDDAGEPTTVLDADHPLMAGSILFGDVDGANMMSYISTYRDDGVRRKIGLSDSQVRIIRLMTRSPARLMLANYRVP